MVVWPRPAVNTAYRLAIALTESGSAHLRGVYKDFWKTLAKKRPALATFIERTDIAEWIGLIVDMRHAGAHHSMLLPSQAVIETEDPKKTDAEIQEILRRGP